MPKELRNAGFMVCLRLDGVSTVRGNVGSTMRTMHAVMMCMVDPTLPRTVLTLSKKSCPEARAVTQTATLISN